MKKVLAGAFGCMLLASLSVSAKEYLGFDLGKDSFEKVTRTLTENKIVYIIEYEKDKNGNDIKKLPVINLKEYPLWKKYGKVSEGHLFFVEGTLSSLSVAWEDKSESIVDLGKTLVKTISRKKEKPSLYQSLDTAFRKKYEIMSFDYEHNGKIDALYKDGTDVKITLIRSMIKPNMNPLGMIFITTVAYYNNELSHLKENMIASINEDIVKTMMAEKRKNDPDLLFANDF